MKKILFFLSFFFTHSFATISMVDAPKIEGLLSENVIVIDIRRDDEVKEKGFIKGAKQLTFYDKNWKFDMDSWMIEFKKIVTSKQQKFALVCSHGIRSRNLANLLSIEKYENVYDLKGGIQNEWLKSGRKVVFK